jgi:hypothetical protein
MNTISGSDAVEIAGTSPPFFFLNFDIFTYFLLGSASDNF